MILDVLEAIAVVGILALAFYGAWTAWWGSPKQDVGISQVVDTTHVAFQIPESKPTEPETHILYETVYDTVDTCVSKPANFNIHGLISREPVSVSRKGVTLTYFQPSAGRYEEAVYAAPQPRWAGWAEVDAGLAPSGQVARARLGLTYRSVSLWGGFLARSDGHLHVDPVVGITYRTTLFER